MKFETFSSFVPSILELKLDQAMMFKWQRHTQSFKTVPDYVELLEFLDLHTRPAENAAREGERKRQLLPPEKKSVTRRSYAPNIQGNCGACKTAKHPVYGSKLFYGFPTPEK